MALNIKDEETDRLARELADLTGQPITTAVKEAIEAQLDVVRRRRSIPDATDLTDIIRRGRNRPVRDDRSEMDLLGYDEDGLPQ